MTLPERIVPLVELDVDWAWNSRSPANVRSWGSSEVDEESSGLEGLVRSILSDGQRAAVDVRQTTPPFYKVTSLPLSLVAGFRRTAALGRIYADDKIREELKKAGKDGVPGLPWGTIRVRDHGPLSEKQALLVNAAENGPRENLTPPDTLNLVRRLTKDHGVSPAEAAVVLGKTPAAVSSYLKLLKLPPKVVAHWGTGGEYAGIRSMKRVSVADMLDLAKRPAVEVEDAYVALLKEQAPKVDSNAWIDRARERATAVGSMLGRLHKAGFLTVNLGQSWNDYTNLFVRLGTKKMEWAVGKDLSDRAAKAFQRELTKVETNGVAAPGQPEETIDHDRG